MVSKWVITYSTYKWGILGLYPLPNLLLTSWEIQAEICSLEDQSPLILIYGAHAFTHVLL